MDARLARYGREFARAMDNARVDSADRAYINTVQAVCENRAKGLITETEALEQILLAHVDWVQV